MGEGNVESETVETGPGAALDRVIGGERGTHPEPEDRWVAHAAPAAGSSEEVHAHSEHSLWPFIVAVGLLLVGAGFVSNFVAIVVGAIVLMVAVVGWMWEPWSP